MEPDDVTEAFTRWKAAQDDFLAAEQQLFLLSQADSRLSAHRAPDGDALVLQVQVKRAHAENLLMAAMRLLHERRTSAKAQPRAAK